MIQYYLEPADILALNYHHLQKDPNSARKVKIYRGMSTIVILLLALVFARKSVGLAFVMLALAAGVFFMLPSWMVHNIKQQVKMRYRRGGHPEELGERTIFVEGSGLRYKSPGNTHLYPYKTMLRIDEEAMFYAVYTSETQIIYVPFRAFESAEEREQFKEDVQEHIEKAKGK